MTFSPTTYAAGRGNVMYKALAHPLVAPKLAIFRAQLADLAGLRVYDPHGQFDTCDAFLGLSALPGMQRLASDVRRLGPGEQPISSYAGGPLLMLDFDSPQLTHLNQLAASTTDEAFGLEALKLPPDWLTRPDRYLSPLNFVFDLALFNHGDRVTSRITTANYWARYGASGGALRCVALDADGMQLGTLDYPLTDPGQLIEITSQAIADTLGLPSFTGQLLMHAVGAAGHDVLKYVCDYADTSGDLTTTHDANTWPAARYGGIPLPQNDSEQVELLIQNPHHRTIPAGALTLEIPSRDQLPLPFDVPPLATRRWRLPSRDGATQGTLHSAFQLLRPRYQVVRAGRSHVAHANVVREDLAADPDYWQAGEHLGRGYLLVAPLLPPENYDCQLLITPMSSLGDEARLTLQTYDLSGRIGSSETLPDAVDGVRPWYTVRHSAPGHLELSYDAERAGPVDGWLHAIFRYHHRRSGHRSETSFGSHMFNLLNTYRSEPQSYSGPPPGLTTRLFGRPALPGTRGFFSLIYPSSRAWHPQSDTQLHLLDGRGQPLAESQVPIAENGSAQFSLDQFFDPHLLAEPHQLLIRDTRCRLFGYHGLTTGTGA
ncbi:MAG: hypothetical protein AAF736_10730, partial [Pseudomonadota bacterium]